MRLSFSTSTPHHPRVPQQLHVFPTESLISNTSVGYQPIPNSTAIVPTMHTQQQGTTHISVHVSQVHVLQTPIINYHASTLSISDLGTLLPIDIAMPVSFKWLVESNVSTRPRDCDIQYPIDGSMPKLQQHPLI